MRGSRVVAVLSYLAAAVLLLGASGSASARPFFKRPPPPPRLTFTASDGTKIFPEYDSAGHVVGATGTDAAGVVRSIHFDTSVEWDKLNWNADLPFECYTQGYGGTCDYNGQTIPKVHLPDYCYPGYCEVAKTTIVGKYYERGAEVFHYSTVIDPYNYQVFLEMSLPDSRIYFPGTRTKVRYRLGMDGNGEQHLVYTGQADDVALFNVDRQHGNALSIAPQFAGYFPQSTRAEYFAPVMGYMFSHSALSSVANAPLQLYDVTGQPIPWGRLFGDLVIALVAAAGCVESAGIGCMMGAGTAAAGADFWTMETTPNPDGSKPADSLIESWIAGLCHGWDSIWITVTNVYPPISCP